MKKITIGGKPTAKNPTTTPDDWVSNRFVADEPIKRLTIDIPLSLHQRVKSQCALQGENMADVVREFLLDRFGEKGTTKARGQESLSPSAVPELA
jgi:hypothetical protein